MAGLWDFLSDNSGKLLQGGLNYFAGTRTADKNKSAANQYYDRASWQPYNIDTAFGKSLFSGNSAKATLDPRYQDVANRYYNLGGSLFDQMQGGSLDALRDDQLGLLRRLASPYEQQQQGALDQRLFNRGQLGSTTGYLQSKAFNDSLNQADLQRQLEAIGLAQRERQSLFDMANEAMRNEIAVQGLPLQQIDIGGNLGAGQANANLGAGRAPFNAAVEGNAAEQQFWQNIAGELGNFSNGAGAASDLGSLFTAGNGNPVNAIKEIGANWGQGTWGDLSMGPNAVSGASSLFAAPGSAAEWAAFGDAPFSMISEAGIGAEAGAGTAAGSSSLSSALPAAPYFAAAFAMPSVLGAVTGGGDNREKWAGLTQTASQNPEWVVSKYSSDYLDPSRRVTDPGGLTTMLALESIGALPSNSIPQEVFDSPSLLKAFKTDDLQQLRSELEAGMVGMAPSDSLMLIYDRTNNQELKTRILSLMPVIDSDHAMSEKTPIDKIRRAGGMGY